MTDKPTITPDPDNPDHVLLHLPEINSYMMDVRKGALDIAIPAAALLALRDAINAPLGLDPELVRVREALVAEYHRRGVRYETRQVPAHAREQVHGELIGLRGALGIALGGSVEGGTADGAASRYYMAWLARQRDTRLASTVSPAEPTPTTD